MVKYLYLMPKIPSKDKKYRIAGYMGGMVLVVSFEEWPWASKYLVKTIDEGEKEPQNPSKKYTYDNLLSKTYKEIQKIAKDMGLKYKGKKTEIIERILSAEEV